jgi:lipopolysaccharide transport system ATP-binding protein
MATAIEASGVGKRYRRHASNRPQTLKEALLRGFRGVHGERFWALDDVTFSVEAGRTLGLIGVNGAGKSTLLRILAAVESADRGSVRVEGRVGAILEIGAGFHPELTGRENAILASVIAGLSRREAIARLPEVVAFAQLEEFIDSPLRTYSTGMYARLAFAIASHVDPEILLIDEALSVGDLAFQARCIDRIQAFKRAGVTSIIVSHDATRIRDLCDEVLWLGHGRVIAQGPAMEITARYVSANAERTRRSTPKDAPVVETLSGTELRLHENRFGTQEATISAVRLLDAWGHACSAVSTGSAVAVEVEFDLPAHIHDVNVGITLRRGDDAVCLDATTHVASPATHGAARLDVTRLDVAAGRYAFDVGIYSLDWERTYDYHYGAYPLSIVGPAGGAGMLAPPLAWSTPVAPAKGAEGEVIRWPRP